MSIVCKAGNAVKIAATKLWLLLEKAAAHPHWPYFIQKLHTLWSSANLLLGWFGKYGTPFWLRVKLSLGYTQCISRILCGFRCPLTLLETQLTPSLIYQPTACLVASTLVFSRLPSKYLAYADYILLVFMLLDGSVILYRMYGK